MYSCGKCCVTTRKNNYSTYLPIADSSAPKFTETDNSGASLDLASREVLVGALVAAASIFS